MLAHEQSNVPSIFLDKVQSTNSWNMFHAYDGDKESNNDTVKLAKMREHSILTEDWHFKLVFFVFVYNLIYDILIYVCNLILETRIQ